LRARLCSSPLLGILATDLLERVFMNSSMGPDDETSSKILAIKMVLLCLVLPYSLRMHSIQHLPKPVKPPSLTN
jgi:hypothetical protein